MLKAARAFVVAAVVIALLVGGTNGEESKVTDKMALPDFDEWWDYGNPAQTRERFEKIRSTALESGNKSYYLQLLTQIARTYGLESEFQTAHDLLDTVKAELTRDLKLAKVRYLLERGRTFRSNNEPGRSAPLFHESYDLAREIENDFLAIDAAHMIALIEKKTEEKLKWNHAAIELAEKTSDARARGWLGSLYNNMGWFLHGEKKYDRALEIFEKALEFRKSQGKNQEINIARWCIGRTLRSLDRLDEALDIQQALLEEYEQLGQTDGYVYEELAEIYYLKGDESQAQDFFARAHVELSKDTWLVNNEKERLDRLKQLGGLADK